MSFLGLQIITDPSMVDPIEDWGRVRSKARASRRRRRGFCQQIAMIYAPKKEAYRIGNKLVMHPQMYHELKRRIA